MKQEILSKLCCPAHEKTPQGMATCRGHLHLTEDVVAARRSEHDTSDILEGILTCEKCGVRYPVILGVLILVPDLYQYLCQNGQSLRRAIFETPENDRFVSGQMKTMLSPFCFEEELGGYSDDGNSEHCLDVYIPAHYEGPTADISQSSGPWSDFLKTYGTGQCNLYSANIRMLSKTLESYPTITRKVAVDTGCSVGGATYRLSKLFDFVFGVDLSFEAVFTARELLKHSPRQMTSYQTEKEPGVLGDPSLIDIEQCENVEFIVASGTDLPFQDGIADCVTSINLLDVLHNPESHVQEIRRVIRSPGVLILSDPYCWENTTIARILRFNESSEQFTLSLLEKNGFELDAEEKKVPWILRLHDRRWNVYLCHCVCAVTG